MSTNTTPASTLSADQLESFGRELDQIRQKVFAELGEKDAQYIKKVQQFVTGSEIASRAMLLAGWLPPAWLAGTALLATSKIVDNMELGHNVMHGQYDWIGDNQWDGNLYEWDNACPGDGWRHSHNVMHHTYTNVEGMDRDIGYEVLRLFDHQQWKPHHLVQPINAALLALFFQWGVALHDLEMEKLLTGETTVKEVWRRAKPVAKKGARQLFKDYAFFPALAGPAFLPVLTGNLAANAIRNIWAFAIIFCGHFTDDVETFDQGVVKDESRGHWYWRQIRGSANLSGNQLFHFLSGNLSFQVEHHLFPDMPAVRYQEIASDVQAICEKYGVPYNTGPFSKQFGSVLKRVWKYSFPTRNHSSQLLPQ